MEAIISLVFMILLMVMLIGAYFLPAIMAWVFKAKNSIWIFALTVLTGWTVIGWIIAFLWAVFEHDGTDLVAKIKENNNL